jgi:hypothetical protein
MPTAMAILVVQRIRIRVPFALLVSLTVLLARRFVPGLPLAVSRSARRSEPLSFLVAPARPACRLASGSRFLLARYSPV